MINVLYEFGSRDWSNGGLTYSLDGKARRRMIRAVGPQLAAKFAEQANKIYIVVSPGESVLITAARRLRRKRR